MIRIRPLERSDREPIRKIVEASGVFSGEEVDVAIELVDVVLNKTGQNDYSISVAVDEQQRVIGYYCIGLRPLTTGTFDLYWIAVDPTTQNHGVGKQLLANAEEQVRSFGGHLLLAETSSQPKYENTRQFYLHNRYAELARIKEFYKRDDDLVIYGKYVSQSRGT